MLRFSAALFSTTDAQKRLKLSLRYLCLKPPPEAISAIARDQKMPEERRGGQGREAARRAMPLTLSPLPAILRA